MPVLVDYIKQLDLNTINQYIEIIKQIKWNYVKLEIHIKRKQNFLKK